MGVGVGLLGCGCVSSLEGVTQRATSRSDSGRIIVMILKFLPRSLPIYPRTTIQHLHTTPIPQPTTTNRTGPNNATDYVLRGEPDVAHLERMRAPDSHAQHGPSRCGCLLARLEPLDYSHDALERSPDRRLLGPLAMELRHDLGLLNRPSLLRLRLVPA